MEIFLIPLTALLASCLTFFSGFGLATLLTPVFVIFFSVDTAIALTAIVHFLNNILKFLILSRKASWHIVLKFGLPAFAAAFIGAKVLLILGKIPELYTYELLGKIMTVTILKLALSVLIFVFVLLELIPAFKKISFSPKVLPVGGVLSGFLGGLSGIQGALRSMFLIKCGLEKEAFIATGVVIACMVDISRLFVYWSYLIKSRFEEHAILMSLTVLAAFIGVFAGSRLMKKVTMRAVQVIVSAMLLAISFLLGAGII